MPLGDVIRQFDVISLHVPCVTEGNYVTDGIGSRYPESKSIHWWLMRQRPGPIA